MRDNSGGGAKLSPSVRGLLCSTARAEIVFLLCLLLSLSFVLLSVNVASTDRSLFTGNGVGIVGDALFRPIASSSIGGSLWALDERYRIDINVLSKAAPEANAYFANFGTSRCFLPGSTEESSLKQGKCVCKANYFGADCGIPAAVWHLNKDLRVTPRSSARRVVMGLVINHELEMTEIRLRELNDLVDVYIVHEANVSAAGTTKPLFLYDAMSTSGFVSDLWPRLLHVVMWAFPEGYVEDGWKADEYIRTHMSQEGLARIDGLRDDDLFLTFDADELIKPEVVLFLKLYDGYPELVRLTLRWTAYGFFWQQASGGLDSVTRIRVASRIGFLRDVCHNDAILLRRHIERCPGWDDYVKAQTKRQIFKHEMEVGVVGDYGGHHCSWCFSPEDIRFKLVTAQMADGPRWGNYPEKTRIEYIETLIKKGEWFDGSHNMRLTSASDTRDFAPAFVLNNVDDYQRLLVHPDLRNNTADNINNTVNYDGSENRGNNTNNISKIIKDNIEDSKKKGESNNNNNIVDFKKRNENNNKGNEKSNKSEKSRKSPESLLGNDKADSVDSDTTTTTTKATNS